MYRMYFYKAALFAAGAALVILGIVIISQRELLIAPLSAFAAAVLLIHAARNIFIFFSQGGRDGRKRPAAKLITAAVNIAIGVVIAVLPELTFSLATYLLAAYLLFNAASKAADIIVAKINRQPGHYTDAIALIFYIVFTVLLIANGTRKTAFLIISGIYCILFGAEILSDFAAKVIPQRVKNDLKRHIRISLPVFVSTFMPLESLRYINEYISLNDRMPETNNMADSEDPPDLEVMVHVSDNGSGRIGHLDIYIDGEVVSFGNYDLSSQRLFGAFGDGVLFIADKQAYIDFSVTHDRQMIFAYGLRLTTEQLTAVRAEISRLKQNTVLWKAPYQRAVEEHGEDSVDFGDFKDYASAFWNGTHADFYKFTAGKFRIYSILSTNCVMLADSIIGKAGTDIICLTGVASPGIYYDYLERLYLTNRTMVVSKTIYDKNTIRI